jgi:DNA-binding NarL/FixJ family response regulator
MTFKAPAQRERVLFVAAAACERAKAPLVGAGREIIDSASGEDAISRAKRSRFDLAVLVSTGRNMDMAETVFNLRDTRPSMPIIIMTLDVDSEEAAIIAAACPNVRALSSEGLADYIVAHGAH